MKILNDFSIWKIIELLVKISYSLQKQKFSLNQKEKLGDAQVIIQRKKDQEIQFCFISEEKPLEFQKLESKFSTRN